MTTDEPMPSGLYLLHGQETNGELGEAVRWPSKENVTARAGVITVILCTLMLSVCLWGVSQGEAETPIATAIIPPQLDIAEQNHRLFVEFQKRLIELELRHGK